MSTKAIVLTIVGAGCIGAAAAGGYVAVRLNEPAQAMSQPTPAATPAAPVADHPAALKQAAEAPLTTPSPRPAAPITVARTPDLPPLRTADPPLTRVESTTKPRPTPTTGDPVVIPPAVPVQTPATPPPVSDVPPPVTSAAIDVTPPAQELPKPRFEELTVKEDSVIGIRLDATISTETARVEDKVIAKITRDVLVAGRTAIPQGARLEGTVTLVEKGGKFRDRARLGVRFHTLLLADNTRVAIQTDTLFRDGEPPTGEASSKVGAGAVMGAILGAVIGGKKGAAIGGAAGAAGGTAAVMAGGSNVAVIPAGSPLTVRLSAPVTVIVEREQEKL